MEFKVGDIVEDILIKDSRGVVMGIYPCQSEGKWTRLMRVQFNDLSITAYRTNGTIRKHHTEPSLRLISRPKSKIKKTLRGWVNVYDTGTNTYLHESKEKALKFHEANGWITCVEVSGEYEVEE